jgi:hypothetical protein
MVNGEEEDVGFTDGLNDTHLWADEPKKQCKITNIVRETDWVYDGSYTEYGREDNILKYTISVPQYNSSKCWKVYDYSRVDTMDYTGELGTPLTIYSTGAYEPENYEKPDTPVTPDFDNTTNYRYNVIPAGDSYGFSLNNNYYESTNQSMDNSYALCRVLIEVTATTDIVFGVINYGESNYDYGIIGNLNQELLRSNEDDGNSGNSPYYNFKGQQSD